MLIGPKYKITRRVGALVFEKTQTAKFAVSEARKSKNQSKKRPRAQSDFGLQLNEKQKARYVYGLTEKQFRNYVREAIAQKNTTSGEALYQKLEGRIDNIIYRSGLARTRRLARQIVSHGHILVNGRKITIPSHILSKGDEYAVRPQSQQKKLFTVLLEENTEQTVPNWISFDKKSMSGKITGQPALADAQDILFNVSTILEFYTK